MLPSPYGEGKLRIHRVPDGFKRSDLRARARVFTGLWNFNRVLGLSGVCQLQKCGFENCNIILLRRSNLLMQTVLLSQLL